MFTNSDSCVSIKIQRPRLYFIIDGIKLADLINRNYLILQMITSVKK